MPSKLIRHPSPPRAPSFLSSVQPDAVPGTEELQARLEALQKLRIKHLEKSKHAADNLRASEEEIRRIKEREKGKNKAIEKIKRERDCAYPFSISDLQSSLKSYFSKTETAHLPAPNCTINLFDVHLALSSQTHPLSMNFDLH